ncbi:hypothetical protein [Kitasatospora sp. NPDC088134]|uniref:hypothetical protein n=1 Tax=Kitasatospora sp. NPDC088134 TaxID=3364071 RepID=UPI0037FD1498
MNRSRSFLRSHGPDVPPGEAVVATEIEWPHRGPVPCPAAPLLAGSLRQLGLRVRLAPIGPVTGATAGGSDVLAVSYVDRRGVAAGFAVAVHPAVSLAVGDVVGRWYDTLRSRRLVTAATQESCHRRCRPAGPPPRSALGDHPGPVPHPAEPVRDPAGQLCPLLDAAADDVAEYAGRGDTVVVVGRPGTGAAGVLLGRAPGRTVLLRGLDEAAALTGIDPDRVSFVVQPGMPLEDAMPAVAALRERFPRLRGQHFDILCPAASDRLAAVRSAGAGADLALVLGEPDEDSRALARASGAARVRVVSRLDQIGPETMHAVTTVVLAPAHSMPPGLDTALRHALGGLGPLSVSTCMVRTRHHPADEPALPVGC